MDLELHKKVFLVAGSTQGIGLGIAECFLKEGARVVITGRTPSKLKEAFDYLSCSADSNSILPLEVDMEDLKGIQHSLNCIQEAFGRLDGVVANIGSGAEPLGVPTDPTTWEASFHKNLRASLQLAQAAFPFLKENGGSLTFISSIAGIEDMKAPIGYSIHKAGIIAASKKFAREFAPFNIRVNVVAPGNILFPGGGWETKTKQDPEAVADYIKSAVPLNCFGTPEDIGNVCVFLSSGKAQFITGSTIVVDGGQTKTF